MTQTVQSSSGETSRGLGTTAAKATNLILYKVGWLACVGGAAAGWPGWSLTLLLLGVHLLLSLHPKLELKLIAASLALGLLVEAILIGSGALRYAGPPAAGLLPPIWIAVLWLQFGSVQHFGFSWLSRRYLLAGAIGLLAVPPAYLAGERLGAVTLGGAGVLNPSSILVISVVWAAAMPLLVGLADRWRPERATYRLPRARLS